MANSHRVMAGDTNRVDVPRLRSAGVAAVLGPGTADAEVVATVRRAAEAARQVSAGGASDR